MTAPGGLFDDIYQAPTTRRPRGLFDDIYAPREEPAAPPPSFRGRGAGATFEGPGLLERTGRTAKAATSEALADIAGLGRRIGTPGAGTLEAMLRGMAGRERSTLTAPRTAPEYVAQFAGEMVPGVAATMAGTGALRAMAGGTGRVAQAARTLLGPARISGTIPQQAAGIVRQNIGGAVAALPISVPGALAEAPGRSPTGMLGVESTAGKLAGDIALDVLGGTALEAAGRGLIGTGRAIGRGIAGRRTAAEQAAAEATQAAGQQETARAAAAMEQQAAAARAAQQAREAEQQQALERLMAEPGRPISQLMREFERTRAGYGPRELEIPARPTPSGAPTVQEAIAALREPFVGRARAERELAENAAQVEAAREQYRQLATGVRGEQLTAQARIAAEEAQAAADQLAAPTTTQQRALEALRMRAPGLAMGVGQAALGAGAGYAAGETPEERAQFAMLAAGVAGVPRLGGELAPMIPQEVRATGRFGFVRLPENAVPNMALEQDHLQRVLQVTEPILRNVVAPSVERPVGIGYYKRVRSPNSQMHFDATASDEAVRKTAAVQGLSYGQDAQVWLREARPEDTRNVVTGIRIHEPNKAPLNPQAVDEVIEGLKAPEMFGEDAAATIDKNGHLLVMNFSDMSDQEFRVKMEALLQNVVPRHNIDARFTNFYSEYLDGPTAYLRVIGRDRDALQRARDAIVGAGPEYRRYAEAMGADGAAVEREVAARVESLDRLIRQVDQPPPLGEKAGRITVAEAAEKVYRQFTPLPAQQDEVVVPEMVNRFEKLVDDLVTQGVIPREMAQDWYRGATLDQRKIARLALPELREDPKYTLYTIVNSILSSGQKVPVESRQGLNVFNQYLKTKRFSILDPEGAQYKQALTGGKKGFTGWRGGGLGEAMAASPRTLNHEQALARLDALVQAYGEEGAIEALVGTVPIMGPGGKVVKEERPALVYLFGPKIGQYAMDKLGIPGGGKSTIDLWMARMDYALRGDPSAIRGNKLNDTVLPTMRRRMQSVLAEFAARHNMPESGAQALGWYAIKNAFRNAGAKEDRLAYATLGSGTTEAMLTGAGELPPAPLAQGLMTPGSYERAIEGWDDPTLRKFAKATGREGTIRPTAGPFTGKVFDIGGALGEGIRTPAGRQILAQAGVGGVGAALSQSEDERLARTGQQMMGLAALAFSYPALRQAGRAGGVRVRDALAQTSSGRKVLNTLSYDILADPRVKSMVEEATTEMARYRAIGQQLAAEARALGPQGDRIVSDLVEREQFEPMMSPDDMAAAIAVANRVADAVQGLGEAKVGAGLISPQTFAQRARTYLPRRYGRYAGEEAAGAVQPEDLLTSAPQFGQGKTFRIKGERQRLDLTPEQRLGLGEIREASYRIADAFGRGGKDIASARLFAALSDLPGAVEPRFKEAFDEAVTARGLRDAARETGDVEAARDANQAYLAARQRAAQVADEFTRGGEYVKLPDTNALGVLKGAVVRKDVADYLNNVPSFSDTRTTWARLFQEWKRIHTVYNPGTHVGNFISNAALTHMGGLPVPMQAAYLARAAKGLKSYDADVKFLTEAGVLERGLPLYGDVPVKGRAQDELALRTLARTTRPETREALRAQGLTPMGRAELGARQFGAKVERAYALEDGVYRVALFKKFRADGMEPQAAADQVMKVLPGYDTRSPLLTGLRNTVSPFILYPAKYIPAALDLIMQHPERWVALAALWGALDQASRRKYEPMEQRDLPPNQRSLGYIVPGRVQVDALVRPAYEALGIPVPAGDKYTFDVARWTPFSALTGSPAPGAIATQISEDIPAILQPGGPIQDIGALMINRDPFTGEPILEPGMTPGEKAKALGKRALGLVAPSAVSFQIPRVLKDIQRGDTAAAALDALGLVGLRPQVVKPGLQGIRERKKHDEAVQNIRFRLRTELRRNQNPERAQRLIEEAQQKLLRENARYLDAIQWEEQ